MIRSINFYRLALHCLVVLVFLVVLPLNRPPEPPLNSFPHIEESERFLRWIILSATLIPFYFINVYFLLPHYLMNRKYFLYVAVLSACFLVLTGFSKLADYLLFEGTQVSKFVPISMPVLPMLFRMFMLVGIGTSFEMILQWEKQKRMQESIEKEKTSAELSFLKSQINPHFLFNTLNNIYSLAERNSNKTGQSILLLSNLMRYVLYDTKHGKILLSKEIKHMDEYIALNRLRIVESENVSINFTNKVKVDGILIEPLIFIPFIENAFKHGISYASNSFISIELSIQDDDCLELKVTNSKKFAELNSIDQSHQGIGIANTQRRLELLYPGRYDLIISDERDSYFVKLSIKLQPEFDFA